MVVRLLIFFFVSYTVVRFVRQLIAASQPQRPSRPYNEVPRGARPATPPRARESAPLTPWEVLGVSPNASSSDVKRAYQALVRQYHPDKVSDLGVELRELAEARTKEINAAYNQLKRSF